MRNTETLLSVLLLVIPNCVLSMGQGLHSARTFSNSTCLLFWINGPRLVLYAMRVVPYTSALRKGSRRLAASSVAGILQQAA